jgi:RND superfamily putative drug exporter
MFCVAFGLSMDYEVFLLSRIKEEHDRTGDNIHSVAFGLERTGGLVTALAALLAVVFIAFAISKITFIKLFGIGLAMAVLVDATIIRATLVPAFMRLAGNANWWAPTFLRRVYDRYGVHDLEGSETEGMLPPPAEEPEPERVIDLREPAPQARTRKPATPKRVAKKSVTKKRAAKKATAKKVVAKKSAAKRPTAKRPAKR